MGKSLGDYNIERSSSTDLKNIIWTKKNPTDPDKPKKKNNKQTSPTNIIHSKNTKIISKTPKIFKIEEKMSTSKKKKTSSKAQNSSLSNCKIEQGYKRKAR
ncbi:hypothetical protein Nisw_00630 [Candidatus Nitrosopumilus sp. SW]|uniref:hypothetical protein n=1 Tax=Candidatus Nitrosopumilus sp. SW TaxID=2508726 RepID=UPI0011534FE0|nr:hypothetical protein [Candidatus Nitrosopumilus sp. SW]QDI88137.1 hypothetical protein Nisw_00630 [Candidatus Nitrosopumilus sp. SW]